MKGFVKEKEIPTYNGKTQQYNLKREWGSESYCDLFFYFYPKNRALHEAAPIKGLEEKMMT